MADNIGVDTGDLRHRVVVQQNIPTPDGYNQPKPVWTDWVPRWAKIEAIAGGDFVQSAQIRNTSSHVITMRYLPGITPQHRIVFGVRVFNITSIINSDERNISTICYAKEVI